MVTNFFRENDFYNYYCEGMKPEKLSPWSHSENGGQIRIQHTENLQADRWNKIYSLLQLLREQIFQQVGKNCRTFTSKRLHRFRRTKKSLDAKFNALPFQEECTFLSGSPFVMKKCKQLNEEPKFRYILALKSCIRRRNPSQTHRIVIWVV